MPNNDNTLLRVRNLRTYFRSDDGLVKAVDDVSFRIDKRQIFALVGESGCGKSVTSFSILRLLQTPPAVITSQADLAKMAQYYATLPEDRRTEYLATYGHLFGSMTPSGSPGLNVQGAMAAPSRIEFEGQDLLHLSETQMRHIRGSKISMIFQEPMSSLNPVYTCGNQIVEAIQLHQHLSAGEATKLAIDLLNQVGIPDPAQRFTEYPHQLSGGMRQRVMIAMALSCNPQLLIADEPTTALDVTIQAQILDLLKQLQRDVGLSILLITHDLAVVAETADVVAVMYASKIVELADVKTLFAQPLHPYTQGLFRSIPRLGQKSDRLATIPGTVPNPLSFPAGCKFHPRCDRTRELAAAADDAQTTTILGEGAPTRVLKRCACQEPTLREIKPGHWASCWETPGYETAPLTDPSEPRPTE